MNSKSIGADLAFRLAVRRAGGHGPERASRSSTGESWPRPTTRRRRAELVDEYTERYANPTSRRAGLCRRRDQPADTRKVLAAASRCWHQARRSCPSQARERAAVSEAESRTGETAEPDPQSSRHRASSMPRGPAPWWSRRQRRSLRLAFSGAGGPATRHAPLTSAVMTDRRGAAPFSGPWPPCGRSRTGGGGEHAAEAPERPRAHAGQMRSAAARCPHDGVGDLEATAASPCRPPPWSRRA